MFSIYSIASIMRRRLQTNAFNTLHCWAKALVLASLSSSVLAVTRTNGIDPIIQIFTGGLDSEGVLSSSLHVNGAPVGTSRNVPPGFTRSNEILLITPELDYGISSDLEGSVYMPMVANLQGGFDVAGGIGRLTWVPWDVPEEGGFFAGTTWAFSGYQRRFSFSSYSLNGGFTTGYEDDDWLVALNGFVNWNLSGSESRSTPSFSPAVGIKRYLGDHLGLGVEYYGDIGSITKPDPTHMQYQALFGVVDWDEDHWGINFGIGRGMTPNTDEWMVKMIVFALIDEPEKKSKQNDGHSLDLNSPHASEANHKVAPAFSSRANGIPLSNPNQITSPANSGPGDEDDDDD